jgi:adenylate cyclase
MLANVAAMREDPGMDFEAAGLLEGLEGEDRVARERLLEQLASEGVGLEELKEAVAEERLALLPVERALGGDWTAREIERKSGVPTDVTLRIRRLSGLPEVGPDDPLFTAEDLEAAKSVKVFLDAGFSEEAIAQITRVLGEGMSRLAATITAIFGNTFLERGDSEEEVALRFKTLAEQLTPALTPVLVAVFNGHLREAVRRGVLGRAERESGEIPDAQELGVCFADLVGFTRLGGEVGVEGLGTVAARLSELAAETSVAPVRLVKTIGDAAMFVSPEIPPLVDAALSLVEAVETAELPALRAGIASGPATLHSGDYYGHSVNLSSRVTGIARPGSVLCTEAVRDAAREQFEWSFAGRHRLKGIGEPLALYRARRLGSGDDEEDGPKRPTANRRRKRVSR